MKLKLAEMADIAQIVASIAVVVSLVYVGIQVNDNARAVRSAAANDAAVAMQNWYLEVGSNRQTSDVFINSMRGTGDLSVEDEFQYLMIQHAGFLGLQNSFLLSEEGTLDPSIAASITAIILGVKDLPGFELYWRQRKDYLHPGFVEYVEQLRDQEYKGSTDIYRALPNDWIDPLFTATVQATEEAIVNAMIAAETIEGVNGLVVHAIPHDRLRAILKKYGRLKA